MLYIHYTSIKINKRITRHEHVAFIPGTHSAGPAHENLQCSREGQLCSFLYALEVEGERRGEDREGGEELGGI